MSQYIHTVYNDIQVHYIHVSIIMNKVYRAPVFRCVLCVSGHIVHCLHNTCHQREVVCRHLLIHLSSQNVIENSILCNDTGDLICGQCQCPPGW